MKTISNSDALKHALAPQTLAAWSDCWHIQVLEVFNGDELWTTYGGVVCGTDTEVIKALPKFRGKPYRIVRPDWAAKYCD